MVTDIGNAEARNGILITILTPKADEIIIGDNVTLRCRAVRPHYTHMYWKINGKYLTYGNDPDYGYNITYSVPTIPFSKILDLTIFNINYNQSGIYTCRGQLSMWNDMGDTDVKFYIHVLNPQMPDFGPETTQDTTIKVTKSSGTIELICDARGVPKPKVAWRKISYFQPCINNETTCSGNQTVLWEDKKLMIPRYDSSYSGTYECIIFNRIGNRTKQFRVIITVEEKFIILNVCLGLAAITLIVLASLAVRYYRKSKIVVQ